MKLSQPYSASARARESGTIIVILLILMSLFAVITIGASHSLARLRAEVLALEQRHAARTAAEDEARSPGDPAPNPGVPAAQSSAPSKPDEPAR